MRIIFRTICIGICLSLTLLPQHVSAEPIIVRHQAKPGIGALERNPAPNRDELLKSLGIDAAYANYKEHLPVNSAESALFELPQLPQCAVSQVRSVQAGVSNSPNPINYIFYSPHSSSDQHRAAEFGNRAIGYRSGKFRIDSKTFDVRSGWAEVFGVKCLPTLVRFEDDQAGRRIRYYEGAYAWEVKR